MNMQDTLQLSRWLRSHASLQDVEAAQPHGTVGNVRFTEQARRAYLLLWAWSAPRFSGAAGWRQDRFYEKCGAAALQRRYARAAQWAAKLR